MFRNIYKLTLAMVIILPILLQVNCRAFHAKPRDISTKELHEMMASGQDFALVNVLPKIVYDSIHLPGSINYPIGKLEKMSILPFSKDIPLVFYCMGYL